MAGFRYYGDTLYFDDGRGVEGEDNNHYPIIIKDTPNGPIIPVHCRIMGL